MCASDDIDSEVRELLRLMPAVLRGFRRPRGIGEARERFRHAPLGPRHFPALVYVALDGPMSVSELAERLGVTLTTASLMVGELSRGGLVERREDELDRRRTIVRLAERQRAALETWLESRAAPLRAALTRLSPDERAAFLKGMRALAEELGGRRC